MNHDNTPTPPEHHITRQQAEALGYRVTTESTWGAATLLGVEPDDLAELAALAVPERLVA